MEYDFCQTYHIENINYVIKLLDNWQAIAYLHLKLNAISVLAFFNRLSLPKLNLVCFYICSLLLIMLLFIILTQWILTVYGERDVVPDSQVRQEGVESQAAEAGVVIPGIRPVLYHSRVTNLKHKSNHLDHINQQLQGLCLLLTRS